jgi:hypothetical protein
MRILSSLATCTLVFAFAPSAHADRRAPAHHGPAVAAVDDEPTSREATRRDADAIAEHGLPTRGTGDGQRQSVTINTPAAVGVDTGAPAAAVEHGAGAPPASTGDLPPALTDDALVELAARQMRRQRRALDACAADAQRKHPAATGTVTLRLQIEDRKVAAVTIDKDTLHDAALSACLTTAARALSFSLKTASFYWPVTLSPTASR